MEYDQKYHGPSQDYVATKTDKIFLSCMIVGFLIGVGIGLSMMVW